MLEIGNGGQTDDEYRAFFSMWCAVTLCKRNIVCSCKPVYFDMSIYAPQCGCVCLLIGVFLCLLFGHADRSMLASPLVLGNDVRAMTAEVRI